MVDPVFLHLDELAYGKQDIAAAYAISDQTLAEIADAFDVHYSTVSRAANGKWLLCCKT
jgi:DNA-binding transcriptional regulator PaaX